MANAQKPEVTKEQVEHAQNLWHNFTKSTKWSVIAVIICLALMALLLV